MSKQDFIIAYQWYNGCTKKQAEKAYRELSEITKRLYIESFYNNAKRCALSD